MFESNRNKRSQSRDVLSKYVNNLSISNMDTVRIQLGMLSILASQSDELSRKSLVIFLSEIKRNKFKLKKKLLYLKNLILNQCIRLIEFLEYFSTIRPVKEVKKTTIGLISILGSIKSVTYKQL
jgi:hypothetical protein